jgi:GT2 family glycosyltransferase
MPAYNMERYIGQSIESALNQTCRDFELVVVDDGSTDSTPSLVASYARRDPRVIVVQQANRGVSAARNAAAARSRGRFLTLLDGDDVWRSTYLTEQLAIFAMHPDIDVLSANALNLGGPFDAQPMLEGQEGAGVRRVSLRTLIEAEASISILTMFRRQVVEALRGFDETLRLSEDYDFWLRAAEAGFIIAVNPKPLGLYRRRPDSLSADEGRMLEAITVPLRRLRQRSASRPDLVLAIDRQLECLLRRRLVADARSALLAGNMNALAARFSALATQTGGARYRIASWLTSRAPHTIRWAYWCKTRFGRLTARRQRSNPRLLEHV